MQIDIFSVKFSELSDRYDYLRSFLIDEELSRADKFYFENDRKNYVIGRGILRKLLSEYLKKCPNELQIFYAKRGKPFLKKLEEQILRFNLSHSKDRIIYGFCREADLGIDIEYKKDLFDFDKIAESHFSNKEARLFLSLPANKKKDAFFKCWTRKEAFIKAVGDGLSIPLNSFDVAFLPEEEVEFLSINNDLAEAKKWSLIDLQIDDDYSSALAVKGTVTQINYLPIPNF